MEAGNEETTTTAQGDEEEEIAIIFQLFDAVLTATLAYD